MENSLSKENIYSKKKKNNPEKTKNQPTKKPEESKPINGEVMDDNI